MNREWKPGDVGVIPFANSEERAIFTRDGWVATGYPRVAVNGYSDVRPLVVIDPENGEAVERLASLLWPHYDSNRLAHLRKAEVTADALREFANPTPPKPPADVTARITDRRDNIWRLLADGEWVCVDGPDHGEYLTWDELAATRGPLEVQP